jgi:hypothetical protein
VGLSELGTYRGLFILSGLLGAVTALAIMPVRERRPVPAWEASDAARHDPAVVVTRTPGLSRESWHLVIRFMITNSTNGLAMGMLGPFVVYWFYRRFGASSGELAGVFFIINLVSSTPYLAAGRIALMLGSVRAVVITRTI